MEGYYIGILKYLGTKTSQRITNLVCQKATFEQKIEGKMSKADKMFKELGYQLNNG